mmetsp:Transcript_6202/g.24864  ORF Transcript_6202/g.24864 Transcript_6202/m.24864 type:complete len:292 (-) Transcript_6202:155-1030(-)
MLSSNSLRRFLAALTGGCLGVDGSERLARWPAEPVFCIMPMPLPLAEAFVTVSAAGFLKPAFAMSDLLSTCSCLRAPGAATARLMLDARVAGDPPRTACACRLAASSIAFPFSGAAFVAGDMAIHLPTFLEMRMRALAPPALAALLAGARLTAPPGTRIGFRRAPRSVALAYCGGFPLRFTTQATPGSIFVVCCVAFAAMAAYRSRRRAPAAFTLARSAASSRSKIARGHSRAAAARSSRSADANRRRSAASQCGLSRGVRSRYGAAAAVTRRRSFGSAPRITSATIASWR